MNLPIVRLPSPVKAVSQVLSSAPRTSARVTLRAALPVVSNRAFIRAWAARRMQAGNKSKPAHG